MSGGARTQHRPTRATRYAAAGWKQVEVSPAISGVATNVGIYAMEKAAEGASWAAKNPGSAACAAVAVGGLAVVAAPAIATSPMLAVAGFGPSGPVAGYYSFIFSRLPI